MKKRIFSIVMAAMMTGALATTLPAFADPVSSLGSGSDITGESTVTNPVISVVVPTSAAFAIDPYELGGNAGTGISSSSFAIINKSNIPIQADVDIKLTTTDANVLLESKKADAVNTSSSNTNKTMWFGVASAAAVTASDSGTVTDPLYAGTTAPIAPATEDLSKLTEASTNVATVGRDSAKMSFLLNKATYDSNTFSKIDTTTGAASLRFIGAVNNAAAWTAGDVTATVKYTLTGQSDSLYKTNAAKLVKGTANMFSKTNSTTFVQKGTLGIYTVASTSFAITGLDTTKDAYVVKGTSSTLKTAAGTLDATNAAFTLDSTWASDSTKWTKIDICTKDGQVVLTITPADMKKTA